MSVMNEQHERRCDRRELLTIDELLDLTGWGRTVTYRRAAANDLPFPTLKSGSRYFFSRRAFERWLEGNQQSTI